MSALDKYEEFHGKPATREKGIEFHVPKSLVYLGEAVAIEYKCDKLNGGGDGKQAIYRHKFGKNVMICMDERSKKQLYIIGNQLFVNDTGINK